MRNHEDYSTEPQPRKMPSPSILTTKSQINVFIARLAKVISSVNGLDRVFMLIQYTLTLLLPNLHRIPFLKPYRTALILETPTTVLKLDQQKNFVTRMMILRDLTADYRIFMRLFGFVPIWSWATQTANSTNQDLLENIQVAANLAYQPLENAAYLAQHHIIHLNTDVNCPESAGPLP